MRLVYQRDDRGLLQARLIATPSGWPNAHQPVRSIVRRTPPVLTANDRLREAATRLEEEGTGALPVRDGAAVGIISERDIANAVAYGLDPRTARVASVMTRDVISVTPDTPLIDVARLMAEHSIRHMIVTRRQTPIAIVSVLEVLQAVLPPRGPNDR